MQNIKKLMVICFLTMAAVSSSFGKKIDDSVALNGIKEAKSVFLIDFTDVKTTAFYLKIIQGTHKGFVNQGVKSKMVLVFIGKTVKFLSTKQDEAFEMENEESLKSIQNSIKELAKLGIRMEVCAVATDVFKVDNSAIPSQMDVIADGFISLIGWQTQGYKLVPIF